MQVIMREFEWVEDMIRIKKLPDAPTALFTSMARYYSEMGYDKRQIKKAIREHILRCNPSASVYADYETRIERALGSYKKRSPIHIDHIDVTIPELETIKNIENRQARRVAFALLCLAKYNNEKNGVETYWTNSKINQVMRIANVQTSSKRQCLLYHQLEEDGLIEFSKKVNSTNTKVLFSQDGDVAMKITDMNNLGYRYLMYCGEPYFECQECGGLFKKKNAGGRPPKYCEECSKRVGRRMDAERKKVKRSHKNESCPGKVYADFPEE